MTTKEILKATATKSSSKGFEMNLTDFAKMLRTAFLFGAAAGTTYAIEHLGSVDFGGWEGVAVPLFGVLLEGLYRYIRDNQKNNETEE